MTIRERELYDVAAQPPKDAFRPDPDAAWRREVTINVNSLIVKPARRVVRWVRAMRKDERVQWAFLAIAMAYIFGYVVPQAIALWVEGGR